MLSCLSLVLASVRHDAAASAGPCKRTVHVGTAEGLLPNCCNKEGAWLDLACAEQSSFGQLW